MSNDLQVNIDTQLNILREMASYQQKIDGSDSSEKEMLESVIISLRNQLIILNEAIPSIIDEMSGIKKLNNKKKSELERVEISRSTKNIEVVLPRKVKDAFVKEVNVSEYTLSRIRKEKGQEIVPDQIYKKSSYFIKFANSIFFNISRELSAKTYFQNLKQDIKKANLLLLFESYISMMILSVIISFFVGIIVSVFVYWLYPSIAWSLSLGIAVPIVTFASLWLYPSLEKDSLSKRIEQELPFAVIHMSAISGAGIEPAGLFRIIALSKEYPYLGQEMRKVINQINLYGYDLVNALTNAARISPSRKLAEVYTGLSTTITQGGSLSDFFEKRAESLLNGYRLEREKYTKIAETFMDIYITVVIAAPMILLLIFILLSVGDFNIGLTPANLTVVIIGLITIVNILFMLILHVKQPSY